MDDGSSQLKLSLNLPADSSLFISIDYLLKYLSIEQFPPDPNRGIDVVPSFATFTAQSSDQDQFHSNFFSSRPNLSIGLYSNSLLIMPPVPDMSMPFNVLTLTSSFYALIIGTLIKMTVQKSNEKISDAFKGKKKKTKFQIVIERFRTIRQRLFFGK